MSVLVKGMNKPRRCEDCRCICSFGEGWRCGLDITDRRRYGYSFEELYKKCPLVEVQPVDVRENKRGKWVNGKCDQCGAHAPYWPMASAYYESDYCPDCGAVMRTKEPDCDYERAVDQLEHDMLYEPTFNQDDGSM